MSQPVSLKRSVSLVLLTFYGVGTILGAGIYVLVGEVAGQAGWQTPLAFLFAAVLAGLSAFSYAELAARMPVSAGEAVYVQAGLRREALSRGVGLLIVAIGVISCATLLHGFVGYLSVFFDFPRWWVIVGLALLLGGVAAWGVGQSVWLASLITVVEIGGLLLILWVARDSFAALPEQWSQIVDISTSAIWLGILGGAFVAFYAFIGFEDIVNLAEEVVNPQRTVPRAIMLALVVTTTLYLTVSLAAILSVPLSALAGSEAPLALVYAHSTGQQPVLISLISLLSVINGALVQIVMAARVLYGMSRQGWLPGWLGQVNAITRTPVQATGVVIVLLLVLALWLPLLTLAKATSYVTLLVFALINLSLWRIKRRSPAPPGQYRVPLWVPVVGFWVCGGFLLYQSALLLRHWLG